MSGPFSRPGDNPELGRMLGENGMARVALSTGEWYPEAQKVVLRICQLYPNHTLTGEKLGNAVAVLYCRAPKPQIVGTLTKWALNQGLIVRTGQRPRMEHPRSHGRTTDQYRIVAR